MKVSTLQAGLVRFIDKEILPQANGLERSAIIGAPILGVFDIGGMLDKVFHSPALVNSRVWTDEDKTEISTVLLKDFATQLLSTYGDRYVFPGIAYDLGFKVIYLFKGYVIDANFISTLFKYIEEV